MIGLDFLLTNKKGHELRINSILEFIRSSRNRLIIELSF
jgi:hypothetical protein